MRSASRAYPTRVPLRLGAAAARARGHAWTVGPWLADVVAKRHPPPGKPWEAWLLDPVSGQVRLTGQLHDRPSAPGVVLIVHGLGGSSESPYMVRAARAAHAAGLASLRLNLRGADRRGEDFYHAGLTDDLHAALASEPLERFPRIYVLGFSLGGHVALRLAAEAHDPRVGAVAAVCPPLDLAKSAAEFDRPRSSLYRHYTLRGLKEIYRAVAQRGRPVPLPVRQTERIRTIREWDDRVVAPRHGFRDAEDYWTRVSVAPRLAQLGVPSLIVAAEHDPMVRAHTVRPVLPSSAGRPGRVAVRWVKRGGHVTFPKDVDLGFPGSRGIEAQAVAWLTGPALSG